ncbi:hypothetical protein IDAT_12380 [Pseudidiomarina atlantica]|uniref:ABC transporter permease n=2 Tax=Pseudidiomarina atlantica TaxID=1517416 RepID=A0A094IPY4_9GAMM|nr:hypothetical protein IDAT_12380 [Pseudidiomarina atlantica]
MQLRYLLSALVILLLLSFLHLALGPSSFGFAHLGDNSNVILLDLRLPRALLAMLNGAALGMAGAVLQVVFRNPLAEPGITGIAGGSALAVVLVLYTGVLLPVNWLLPLVGMLGGFLSLLLLWAIVGRYTDNLRLILAGVAVAAFAAALLALVLNLAPNPFAYLEWSLWLLGSVANRGWEQVYLLFPAVVIGALLIASQQRYLSAHIFDAATLATLGFRQRWALWWLLLAITLLISASVVTAGVIGFIGLLAPHLARLLGEHRPPQLVAYSALSGAALLLLIDSLVKVIPTPVEMQLGVIAAFVGAPWLIVLLWRQQVRV